ncbi:acyltransferase family protein [Chitinophaga agrisoli]|uniref:Acyltransferase family protein n=1 Tax=Chitinophaga agrisoli TaxID=2607653 RepID=A0A5B2VMJ4_9BACT|nr:acyltransferase family protein [Chitinophaga agrisoli]KAA2239497.1 acyltransferase family protein [Chitinophaga agrisoli]
MQTTTRQTYLDWLRMLAILGVLLFHSARPFAIDDPWHVNNAASSHVLSEFSYWLSRFRMHLLFFISGTVSWFMVSRKSAGGFMKLRFQRLFIPLLVGIFVIVPPQIYMERLTQGYKGSFWDFYPSVFSFKPYPQGNTSWHHLWFIAYLLVYDVLLTPFFGWAVSDRAKGFVDRLSWLARGKRVYWLTLPTVAWFSLTVELFPQTHALVNDWCFFVYWLLFLLTGFICALQPALMDSLERNRRISLGLAFVCMLLINYLRWNNLSLTQVLPFGEHDWLTPFYIARHPLNAWLWVFAIIGYGKKYLQRKHRALDYINQAVYPFYILHQTVIVIIAFYVVKTDDTIGMKYLFIAGTSFVVSMLIYHLFIRPFAITRLLFGMKSRQPEAKPAEKQVAVPAPRLPEIALQ